MNKQSISLFILISLATSCSLQSEDNFHALSHEPYINKICTWAKENPTCYNSIYLITNTTLTVLAGYAYAKLFLAELLNKQWPDSTEGAVACAAELWCQPYNRNHFLITILVMLATNRAIESTIYGSIFEKSNELSKLKASVIFASGALTGCLLNRYIKY